MFYQSYFTILGEHLKYPNIAFVNKLLIVIYFEMLDTYMLIYKVSTKKWKLKRNLDEMSWDLFKQMIHEADCEWKVCFDCYNTCEKCSLDLMEKVEKLQGELLQRPLILEKGPRHFDFKKEKKCALKHQKEA